MPLRISISDNTEIKDTQVAADGSASLHRWDREEIVAQLVVGQEAPCRGERDAQGAPASSVPNLMEPTGLVALGFPVCG